MKLGRTIAGTREKIESESERLKLREKNRKKNRFSAAIFLLSIIFIGISSFFFIRENFLKEKTTNREKQVKFVPSVGITDESGFSRVTERIKEYSGKIEQDLKDFGYKINKIVLPRDKIREVDIYIEGKQGYFKCNLDRGTAETAEDIDRMMQYLKRNNITIQQYVDVRVEKKAYYL